MGKGERRMSHIGITESRHGVLIESPHGVLDDGLVVPEPGPRMYNLIVGTIDESSTYIDNPDLHAFDVEQWLDGTANLNLAVPPTPTSNDQDKAVLFRWPTSVHLPDDPTHIDDMPSGIKLVNVPSRGTPDVTMADLLWKELSPFLGKMRKEDTLQVRVTVDTSGSFLWSPDPAAFGLGSPTGGNPTALFILRDRVNEFQGQLGESFTRGPFIASVFQSDERYIGFFRSLHGLKWPR